VTGQGLGYFGALERGNPAPDMCDTQVEIINWAESPIPGPYLGHRGVEQWWADLADAFEGLSIEAGQIEGVDNERAVTAQRLVGTFRLTGIELDVPWGSVISVRDQKILRAIGYSLSGRGEARRGEARRAVGLG
jgi:SnoaL-like protein